MRHHVNSKIYKDKFLIIATVALAVCILFLGFILWNEHKRDQVHQVFERVSLVSAETQRCLDNLDRTNPNPAGLSDHRDKSECDPNIVPYDSLSDKEKEVDKNNSAIVKDAAKNQNPNRCNAIKGKTYTRYPANMTKVMTYNEIESKETCKVLVKSAIEEFQRKKEKAMRTFTLSKWDIPLVRPSPLSDVQYYPVDFDQDGLPMTYEFTTKNAETKSTCKKNSNGIMGSLRAISRTKDAHKAASIQAVYLRMTVGEYHYFDVRPRNQCTSLTATGADEGREIESMLRLIK